MFDNTIICTHGCIWSNERKRGRNICFWKAKRCRWLYFENFATRIHVPHALKIATWSIRASLVIMPTSTSPNAVPDFYRWLWGLISSEINKKSLSFRRQAREEYWLAWWVLRCQTSSEFSFKAGERTKRSVQEIADPRNVNCFTVFCFKRLCTMLDTVPGACTRIRSSST